MGSKLSIEDSRQALDIFIDQTLRMMVLSGALAAASQQKNGWWCTQDAGGDPHMIPHECATSLAWGFHLGVKHYHEYRKAMRGINELIAEDKAEEKVE